MSPFAEALKKVYSTQKKYRIGREIYDWPMGCSPWYRTNVVDEYTLEDAKAEVARRQAEADAPNPPSTAYPVWSFRLIGDPSHEEIFVDQETGEPR